MNRLLAECLFILLAAGALWASDQQPAATSTGVLKVGDQAPDFTLPDQDGNPVRLSSFAAKKKVVLAFYIRASTPG